MNPTPLLGVVAIVAVLAGCAHDEMHRGHDGRPFRITSADKSPVLDCAKVGNCKVDVDVGCGGTCITVSHEFVLAARKKITWELNGSGFVFAQNGIQLSSEGRKVLNCTRQTEKKFACEPTQTDDLAYKYTISLIKDASVLTLDPWVINN